MIDTLLRSRKGGRRAARAMIFIACLAWPVLVTGQAASGLHRFLQPATSATATPLPDLFESTFSDVSGFWSRAPVIRGPVFAISRTHEEPITRRLSDGNAFILDRHDDLRWQSPFRGSRFELQVSPHLHRFDRRANAGGRDGGADLQRDGVLAGLDMRLRHPESGLSLLVGVPLWRSDGFSADRTAGWGVRFDPGLGWRVQASRALRVSGATLSGHIKDDPLALHPDLETDTMALDAEFDLGRRLSVGLRRRDHAVDSRAIVDGDDLYEIQLGGDSGVWGGDLRLRPARRVELLYRYQSLDAGVDADVFWGGERFGHLSYLDLEIVTHAVGGRWRPTPRRMLQMEYARSDIDAAGRMKIESFPFTSIVVDLLGQSRFFRGELEATIDRLSLIADWRGDRVTLRGGFSFFDIDPKARLLSWRPVIFGIGAEDIESHDLDVDRLQLLSVLLDLGVDLGRVRLMVSAQQFVWADVREIAAADDPDDPDPDPDTETGIDTGWIGGTWLRAGCRIGF